MAESIEWPPGSGNRVDFDDYESEVMRELLRGGASGRELMFIYRLKVELDARFVPEEEAMARGVCPECEVGAGLHAADCSVGGDSARRLPGVVGLPRENLFVAPEELGDSANVLAESASTFRPPADALDALVEEFPDGHVGPSPEATIREAFLRFHHDNPHVYAELCKLARRARRVGVERVGMKMLFEVLRWRRTIATGGDDFKLNNNYHSYYARLIMRQEPDLYGIFELRKLHGPDIPAAAPETARA